MKITRTRLAQLASVDALADWATIAAVAGLVSGLPFLPSVVRGLLLAFFVFVGPGAAILSWARALPSSAVPALVPVVGMAVVLMVTAAAAMTGVWQPRATLYVLAVAVGASTLVKRRRGRTHSTEVTA
ncbi:MAG: hypothetical protein QOH99_315 [Frankiaceae bacterium]|jgi:hypothetical protein|nr:hypothetical protein [Frankiaceae bacterium]